MTLALVLAASLVMAAPPPDDGAGEPLPPGAPTDSYELAAWCYGALDEYLLIYDKVIPDLKAIDATWGTQVKEAQPYHSDMAAYRVELKLIGDSVTGAEKASPTPIADRGVDAMNDGRHIWSVAEGKPRRELARAWMMWALPDRCDSNARDLAQRSTLLGKALSYNQGAAPAQGSVARNGGAQGGEAQGGAADGSAAAPGPDAAAQPPAGGPPAGGGTPASGDIDQVLSKPAADAPSGDNPAGYPAAKPN
jgi:hypothetical protein